MTTLTFRVPDALAEELEKMCEEQDRTKSWFMKKALQEKMEEWRDIRIALKGRAEYERDPKKVSTHDEILKELGIAKKKLVKKSRKKLRKK
jgi:predicted transcriptional regulator